MDRLERLLHIRRLIDFKIWLSYHNRWLYQVYMLSRNAACDLKPPDITTPISRPSALPPRLAATNDAAYLAWIDLVGLVGHCYGATVMGVGYVDWMCGRLRVLSRHPMFWAPHLPTWRWATPSEEDTVYREFMAGRVEVQECRSASTGMSQAGGQGYLVRILHQATGRPS